MPSKSWLLGPMLALALASPVRADDTWIATEIHGSVLALVSGEWQELAAGDPVASGVAVRTLQAGRAVLRRGGEVLELDRNTAVRPSSSNGTTTIEQYSGTLSVLESGRGTARLVTPTLVAVSKAAGLVSRLSGSMTTVSIRNGTVEFSDGGRRLTLRAGQTYSKQDGQAGITSGSQTDAINPSASDAPRAAATSSPGAEPDNDQGNSTDHDNGVGNGGTPGNGGQNGNAGGNGNGNGNGNGQHKGNAK